MTPAITVTVRGCQKRLPNDVEEALSKVFCACGYQIRYNAMFNARVPITKIDKANFERMGLPALFNSKLGLENETAIISVPDIASFLCFAISPDCHPQMRPCIVVQELSDVLHTEAKKFYVKETVFREKVGHYHNGDLCTFAYPELGIANEPTAPSRKKPLRQPKANLLEPRTKAGHDAEAKKEPCFVSSWDTVTELPTPEQDVDYFFEPTLPKTTWDTVVENVTREPEADVLFSLPTPIYEPTVTETLAPKPLIDVGRGRNGKVLWFRMREPLPPSEDARLRNEIESISRAIRVKQALLSRTKDETQEDLYLEELDNLFESLLRKLWRKAHMEGDPP